MKNLIVAIVALAASVVCAGQRYDWTGENGTGLWNDADNWSPKAIPTAADDVYIAGGANESEMTVIDIGGEAKTAAANCWSLHTSGFITFNGTGYLNVAGVNGSVKEIYGEVGGTYVFNCPLYLSNSNGSSETINWHGRIYLNGGFRYYWGSYFFYGGGAAGGSYTEGGEIHINGGLEPLASGNYSAVAYTFGCNYGNAYIDKGNNWFYRLQLGSRYGTTHVNCDNPWCVKPGDVDYFWIYAGAKLCLHGHDVTFPKGAALGQDSDVGYNFVGEISTDDDKPATLTLQSLAGGLFKTNSSVNIKGPLSVKITSDSTQALPLNRQIDTTGAILVEGGIWDLCAQASFPNISHLRISGNGKVRLAAGVTYPVPKLYLGDSEYQEEGGTYGAPGNPNADFTSEFLEGDGLLVVANTEADTVEATWNGQGGDNSVETMANWVGAPASLPFSNGGLLPTFAVSGAAAQVANDVRFKGVVFDSASDFTLFGAGLVKLGSLGLETKASAAGTRSYTVDVPVKLGSDQTWNVVADTTVTLAKEVSGAGSAVTLPGEGTLVLAADNSFTGNLTIDKGTVDATGAPYALGRANGGNYTAAEIYVDQRTAALHLKDAIIEKSVKTYGAGDQGDSAKLTVEGTNVLMGAYSTMQGDYMRFRPNAVLKVVGEMKGWGYTYFAPKSDDSANKGIINAEGPVNIANFTPQNVEFHFWADSNANGRLEVSNGGELHFHKPMQFSDLTSSYITVGGSGGFINFHGNDQKYGRLILALVPASVSGVMTSGDEGPATLYFNQNVEDTRVNNYGDVAGRLSLVMGGGCGFYNNKALSTAGDLTVTNGTWNFMANGSWLNGTNFTASGVSDACKGRITVAQSKTFGKHAIVHLDGKGVLELGDGVSQRVRELWINGVEMPSGTYGSSQSAAQHKDDVHFAGTGVLRATGGGMMLILR